MQVAAGLLEEVEVLEAVEVALVAMLVGALGVPASQSTEPSKVSISEDNIADCMESRNLDLGIHCNMMYWEQGTRCSGASSLHCDTVHSTGSRSDQHSGCSTIRLIAVVGPEIEPVYLGGRPH